MTSLPDHGRPLRVGVVLPVYDAARTVTRAVRSVLRQRGVDVRVVAVDHGSRDGSAAALRAMAADDDRIWVTTLVRGPREPLSATRPLNAGFAEAVRRLPDAWIMRLDADDVLAGDDVLAAALAAGQARPVIAGMLVLYSPADGTAVDYGPRPELRSRRFLLRGGAYALGHHAMLIRAAVLAPLLAGAPLFDERISYGEDLDASLRILSAIGDDDFAFATVPVIHKFLGAGTITSTLPTGKLWTDQLRVFARHPRMSWSLFARVSAHLALRAIGERAADLRQRLGTPASRVGAIEPTQLGPVLARLDDLASASEVRQ
jgi:glycosyltransferase involved in cell wall biosynthesis